MQQLKHTVVKRSLMENWRLKEMLLLLNLCSLKRQRNCGYVPNRCLGRSSPYMHIAIRGIEVLGAGCSWKGAEEINAKKKVR